MKGSAMHSNEKRTAGDSWPVEPMPTKRELAPIPRRLMSPTPDRRVFMRKTGPAFLLGAAATFDKALDVWYRGRKPGWTGRPLGEIQGLQYLEMRMEDADLEPGSGEDCLMIGQLNLLLPSGRRAHLTDSGNRESLLADAMELAGFLGVPLYGGTIEQECDTPQQQ